MNNQRKRPVVRRFIIFAVFFAVIVAVGIRTELLPELSVLFSDLKISMKTLFRLVVMLLLVLAAENLIFMLLGLFQPKQHRTRTILTLVRSALRYAAAVVVICRGLSIVGVDLGTIAAGVGILALVIGFGAESLIADVVTGIFMLFENQYNVGDYIEVSGFRGKVVSIGIRTTSLEDAGGNVKIINNSSMTNLLNRSNQASVATAVISVPYATDLAALEARIPGLMEEMYAAHGDVMLAAPRYLGVDALADSAVVLKFACDVQDQDIFTVSRIMNHDLLLGFRALGVECPFPQLDVHQK